MMSLLTHLQQQIETLPQHQSICVGYSGGLDSHVLLHALCQLKLKQTLSAIHINHGLSPNAAQWEAHVRQVCQELKIPIQVISVDATRKAKQSPEESARKARYMAFERALPQQSILALAHHQHDQAETFLLQCCRGSGIDGLVGMPVIKPFHQSCLWRPLLEISRKLLEQYARSNHLNWIDDESNFDTAFDRNYMRHQVIPKLQKRWPAFIETLSRTTINLAEAQSLLTELAIADYDACRNDQQLNRQALLKLSEARQRQCLRYWIRQQELPLPNRDRLCQIQTDVCQSRYDATPLVSWPGAEVRRYQEQLYAMPPLALIPQDYQARWDLNEEFILPVHLGVLAFHPASNGLHIPKDARIEIRFRTGGERIQPQGRQGHQRLKHLMQTWRIPPWQRNRIPLIYINDTLACVVGYTIAEEFKVPETGTLSHYRTGVIEIAH